MAKFQITAPDGSQYEIEGENEQGAMQALQAHLGSQPSSQPDASVNDGTVGPSFARGGTAMPEKPMFGGTDAGRSFGQGVANTVMFGFNDEAAAGLATLRAKLPGGNGKSYSDILDTIRKQDQADAEAHPVANVGGMLAGGLAGGAGLASSGLSLGANAARAGQGLGRAAGMSAIDGGLLGAAQGFGNGEGGIGSRATSATKGAALGGILGGAAPLAIAGASAVARPVLAPVMSRLNPQSYANQALQEGLTRSGQSPEDIARALTAAQSDGQGVFTVADALGNSGQRMLSTVTRTPNNSRQAVVEQLMNRQAGQGGRVAGALAEGFGAPDTAAQRIASLTQSRRAAGNANYGAARDAAGAVDTSPAIQAIDDVIRPGVTPMIGAGANDGGVYSTLNRARGLLTNGRSQVSDFDRALLAKQEMDAILEQGGTAANLLRPARNALDEQLAQSSQPYATARNAYRQGSQNIEAVDTGRNAAMRGRSEDTIPAFNAMRTDQQSAFRAGYVDPLIERVQGAATGVNKARPLINDATAAEFPAFAAPGRADQLGARLGREQTMFETNTAAMGGSRTADNLADAADMNRFDPGVISALVRGKPLEAAMTAIGRIGNEARGMPPRVIEQVAQSLMETRPDVAQRLLNQALNGRAVSAGRRAVVSAMMNNLMSGAAGRLGTP